MEGFHCADRLVAALRSSRQPLPSVSDANCGERAFSELLRFHYPAFWSAVWRFGRSFWMERGAGSPSRLSPPCAFGRAVSGCRRVRGPALPRRAVGVNLGVRSSCSAESGTRPFPFSPPDCATGPCSFRGCRAALVSASRPARCRSFLLTESSKRRFRRPNRAPAFVGWLSCLSGRSRRDRSLLPARVRKRGRGERDRLPECGAVREVRKKQGEPLSRFLGPCAFCSGVLAPPVSRILFLTGDFSRRASGGPPLTL